MGTFGSMYTAVSGMQLAQLNLSVTGHNLANASTKGYSRQSIIQSDFLYIGKVGLGTNVSTLRQIRDKFLDASYRTEATKEAFYEPLVSTGEEIENLLGELNNDGATQTIMQDLWDAINNVILDPTNLEIRGTFVNNCVSFADKMQVIYKGLEDYQENLNTEIKNTVDKINYYTKEVDKYNKLIQTAEINGDSANDYRDARNVALDNLSELADVTIKETANGTVDILIGSSFLLTGGTINNVGLKYTDPKKGLVEPVITNSKSILPADSDAKLLYDIRDEISVSEGEDKSYLKGLLIARGSGSATYATEEMLIANEPDSSDAAKYPLGTDDPNYKKDMAEWERDMFNVQHCTIPKFMANIDTLFNKVVTLINDTLAPQDHDLNTAPVGIDENATQFLEIFSRKYVDRYDASGDYIQDDGTLLSSGAKYDTSIDPEYYLYSISNVTINKELLNADGYDKIAFSASGDESDTSIVNDILNKWKEPIVKLPMTNDRLNTADYYEGMGIEDAYNFLVTTNATDTAEANSFLEAQKVLVTQVDSQRSAIMGVSADEEMTNMMQFQYAYSASAQVLNALDEMLLTLIEM